ncbi:MAG: response regulator [Lachnospiraceae bacterium]|nr:response regulator [Lachnospiraceae bacterium]
MTLEFITALMQYLTQFIMIFMIERYVFLEKGLPKKKQRIYYTITLLFGILLQCLVGDELASIYIIFVGAHNIFLARKEHKIRGAFIIAPIIGIVNGLVTPFLYIPGTFADVTTRAMLIYYLVIFSIILALFCVFYLTGKKWRRHYETEMMGRKLQKWELALITIIGIALIVYSILVTVGIQYGNIVKEELSNDPLLAEVIYAQTAINLCWMCVVAFILSVAVIVLVMQGNKRAYYYDKSLAMQKMEIEKQRAEAANEAKSSFLSTMSHEIRTPMNAIVGMTDILLREEHSPQTREYLNNIKSSGNALLTIINDILDFSKIESGKMEIVEAGYEPMSVFHDLSMIFFNRIGEKKIELLYDIDPKMSRKLYGDAQRIRQVILNLMNNAIKFTDKGYVKLKAEVNPLDVEHVELYFRIEDSGQGIKEEDIDKLFGSFSQVDQIRNHHKEGSGLGLAICKQLVELMNGTISVESTYGRGSIFSFKIPQRIVDEREAANLKTDKARNSVIGIKMDNDFAREEVVNLAEKYGIKCVDLKENPTEKTDYIILETNKPLTETEYGELEKSGGKLYVLRNPMKETVRIRNATVLTKPLYSLNFCQLLNGEELIVQTVEAERYNFTAPEAKILIVDDNEMNLKVAKGLLAPFKMHIDVAKNGKEAIQRVLANKYHIVFMDHMMPVMDGVEATKAIRKLQGSDFKNLPIVALSANATSEAKEMFIKEQMSDFVAKPIRMKEITESLLKWLPEDIVKYEYNDKGELGQNEPYDDGLPVINGLNVAEGIKNCGSLELFNDLLNDFYKLIDTKSAKVEKCLSEGLIRDYTIEVHALKSMARMIGALELSEQFYQMEMLGNAGETELIEKRTPGILELYRSYKEVLKDHVKTDAEGKTTVSNEQIEKTLTRLHDAMDSFDLDEADEAMKELERYALPDDIRTMVEKLGVLVTDVAMEEVMALVGEIREKIK